MTVFRMLEGKRRSKGHELESAGARPARPSGRSINSPVLALLRGTKVDYPGIDVNMIISKEKGWTGSHQCCFRGDSSARVPDKRSEHEETIKPFY